MSIFLQELSNAATKDERSRSSRSSHKIHLVLCEHLHTILKYRDCISVDNGDVLCGAESTSKSDIITIHLHISSDGGQMHKFKKHITVWPFHAVILDLPINLRFKPENIILMALWYSKSKPDWTVFLRNYLQDCELNTEFNVFIGNSTVRIIIKFYTAVFDLPAQASILNHKLYNAKISDVCTAMLLVIP